MTYESLIFQIIGTNTNPTHSPIKPVIVIETFLVVYLLFFIPIYIYI